MTSYITGIIVEYTGDYTAPGFRQNKERAELCKKHGVLEEDLYMHLLKEGGKVRSLLRRFALEKEVGSYRIQQKDKEGRPTSEQCTAVVTQHSTSLGKHFFTPWLDNGELTSCLGSMKIEPFTTLPDGRVWSILNRRGVSKDSSLHAYASKGAGCVYIDDLDAEAGKKQYSGIGRGLVQVAAEVSFNAGYDGRVLLQAAWHSPGFYRTVHFSRGRLYDEKLDAILAKAAGKKEAADTSGYSGNMKLNKEGREKYREIIARKPILWGAGAESAKGAKEESKSSKS